MNDPVERALDIMGACCGHPPSVHTRDGCMVRMILSGGFIFCACFVSQDNDQVDLALRARIEKKEGGGWRTPYGG